LCDWAINIRSIGSRCRGGRVVERMVSAESTGNSLRFDCKALAWRASIRLMPYSGQIEDLVPTSHQFTGLKNTEFTWLINCNALPGNFLGQTNTHNKIWVSSNIFIINPDKIHLEFRPLKGRQSCQALQMHPP